MADPLRILDGLPLYASPDSPAGRAASFSTPFFTPAANVRPLSGTQINLLLLQRYRPLLYVGAGLLALFGLAMLGRKKK